MAVCKTSVVTARAIAPVLERLESRRMLAAYDVFGTPGDDAIVVTIGHNGEFTASVNGKRRSNTTDELLIHAGPGNDSIVVSRLEGVTMPVTIYGEAGNDSVLASIGNERIMCGDGDDTVLANNGNDTVYGEAGNDSLRGGAHADLLDGGSGYDTLRGDNGSDNLSGGDNPDRLRGSAGNDYLNGGGGRDLLGGEAGDNVCVGGTGADIVDGGIGADYVQGGKDHDDIYVGDDDGFDLAEAYAGECRDATLTIGSSARLDLTDNKLIVSSTTVGSWNGVSYEGVTGMIASGRSNTGWNGAGITSGQNDSLIWAGQTLTGTDTLVMYTYGGDANLDGKLIIDDYVRVDQGLDGWYNGDFNYDGKVNIDDYATVIDRNIGNQTSFPFPGSEGTPINIAGTSRADRIIVYNEGSSILISLNGHLTRHYIGPLHIASGEGDDVISMEISGDYATIAATITSGAGNDTIFAGGGNDRIDAGDGNDVVNAGGGKNTVYGGLGDDQLAGGSRIDLLDGGEGTDTVAGDPAFDHITAEILS